MAGLSSAARTTNCSCSVENMHGYASKVYSKLPHCGKQNREAKLPLHRRLKQRNNCQSADRKATARLFCLVFVYREATPVRTPGFASLRRGVQIKGLCSDALND